MKRLGKLNVVQNGSTVGRGWCGCLCGCTIFNLRTDAKMSKKNTWIAVDLIAPQPKPNSND